MALWQHRTTLTTRPDAAEHTSARPRPATWALGLNLAAAAAVLAVVAVLLLVGPALAALPGALRPSSRDLLSVARPAATIAGWVCAVVAVLSAVGIGLAISYRRLRVTEATESRAHAAEQRACAKLFNDRFTSATTQLGHHAAAVRLAGVYAIAGLADDWARQRQTCVDVLCAYLRMPYDPENHREGEREVRHSIIRVIRDHLRVNAPTPWHGQDFDFTNATFDGGDLSGVHFTGGAALFNRARFTAEGVNFRGARFTGASVQFRDAEFGSEVVDFSSAEFVKGAIDFTFAKFTSGHVVFSGARFDSDTVDFRNARFTGDMVYFDGSEFVSGATDFSRAEFASGRVLFHYADFSGARVFFNGTRFAGGVLDFNGARFVAGTVNFSHAKFDGSLVDLSRPGSLDVPPVFGAEPATPEGLVLPPSWPGLPSEPAVAR